MDFHSARQLQRAIASMGFGLLLGASAALLGRADAAQPQIAPGLTPAQAAMMQRVTPRILKPMALYEGPIPGAIPGPDNERQSVIEGLEMIQFVSVPQLYPYLPAPVKSNRTAILIFPGGGYEGLVFHKEGTQIAEALQDRGIAAFIVKYRLPSDVLMQDKSIGPLQDAQRAIQMVRMHAAEWNIDPSRVGVIGFSAGGHLASTLGTHFSRSYVPNPDSVNLRPDFMMLVYPVITMEATLTHSGSRLALLGPTPSREQIDLFSNEKQVSDKTPPTIILAATDDSLVPVDNSICFYEALRGHHVPAELDLLSIGEHGFVLIPQERWMNPLWQWLGNSGWSAQLR